MFNWMKRIFGKKKCYICKGKAEQPRMYINDAGEKVRLCFKCVEYAERRALIKA